MMRRRQVWGRMAFSLALALAPCLIADQVQAQSTLPPPGVHVPDVPAAVVVPQPAPPQGQWVNTAEYGWVWVPAGATPVAIGGVPVVYLYTPAYGWTWYASPWGWGPFAVGAWVARPAPFGFRVWHHGPHGWGWHVRPHVRPHVELHIGRAPRFYGPPPHYYHRHHYAPPPVRHYSSPQRHHWHGHRGHWGGHSGRRYGRR